MLASAKRICQITTVHPRYDVLSFFLILSAKCLIRYTQKIMKILFCRF
jgi:hypothetical protein